jgi:hypothetical protein
MLDRTTFYRRHDGTQMTPQEQLALLLEVGNLDSARAAGIARVSKGTIDQYRAPSSTRPVPERVLLALELEVYDRLKQVAKAAGYRLRRAASHDKT